MRALKRLGVQISRSRTTPIVSDLRYTPDSLEFRDHLQELIWAKLRELAIKKVKEQKRSVVTEEDVKACVPEAVRLAVRQLQSEGILGPESSHACTPED